MPSQFRAAIRTYGSQGGNSQSSSEEFSSRALTAAAVPGRRPSGPRRTVVIILVLAFVVNVGFTYLTMLYPWLWPALPGS